MNSADTVYQNISGYLFARLDNLKDWRAKLIHECKAHQLKGTILLSTEGINLFLAGQREDIDHLISVVRDIPGLEKFQAKFSESDHQPFNRMLVRIKKEIISFGVPEVDPATYTSRHLPAQTLKQWLDEGRPVTLLDTRNDYEVKLGTFRNAIPIGVDTFRQFPDAVAKLPEEMKKQPIVTFCTGGIRCEKAAPYMELQGFENIFQLDGGILKYFEEVGGDHYDGECFVFDHRVGLDPSLRETPSAICFHCQAPLEEEEQQDPRYVEGESCPYCFVSEEQKMAMTLEKRRAAMAKVVNPLPGSVPYENLRPLFVKQDFDGWKLLDLLLRVFPHIGEDEWRQRLAEGRFRHQNGAVVDGDQIVRAGERYEQRMTLAAEPDVNADIRFFYEDSALIVIRKPAPLPMHPCGRFHRNTLQSIINQVVHPAPRPVHRLDANTTGLVLYARTSPLCAKMQRQFQRQTIEKTYLVRVQGHPEWQRHCCEAPISSDPDVAGSRVIDETDGLPSRTDFTVVKRFHDGTALLEAALFTGRTNQIRVHLRHLGHPVCGDATYLLSRQVAATQTLDCTDEPLKLHAWRLSCDHPHTGQRLSFEDERPDWAVIDPLP
jgi:RluA family pseudouridine synthase